MTKIKDLVTVLCDNALLFFPVDDERYELVAAVDLVSSWEFSSADLQRYEHGNWRVNLFLRSVDERIRTNASAYATRVAFPEMRLRPVELRRARCVSASILRLYPSGIEGAFRGWSVSDVYAYTCDFLWHAFYQRMKEQKCFCRCYSLGLEG